MTEIIAISKNDFAYIMKNKKYLEMILDSSYMMPSKDTLLGVAARLFSDTDIEIVFNEEVVLES